ncbi:MAG: hypothetical protein K2N06_12450 [Oscillospiraceae bacterium]|nr:hypothetical protein [Oscillospiraceae bacterium]
MSVFKPEIALIIRSDEMIDTFHLKRITIDTSFGPVDRCFEGYVYNVPVLVIYGRFNGQKVPSSEINFQQTIEAIKNKGINKVIGTFVVGGINPESARLCICTGRFNWNVWIQHSLGQKKFVS